MPGALSDFSECLGTRLNTYTCTHDTHTHTHTHMHTHIVTHTLSHAYTHIHIIVTHAHTHTHTHTLTFCKKAIPKGWCPSATEWQTKLNGWSTSLYSTHTHTVLAAIAGAIPFIGPYWVTVPAVLELWLVEGNVALALVVLALSLLPMFIFLDTMIYSEIEGWV